MPKNDLCVSSTDFLVGKRKKTETKATENPGTILGKFRAACDNTPTICLSSMLLLCRWLLRVVQAYFASGRNYIPPPLPPFLAKRHFSGEGGVGVYFEAPRGRNFIPPSPSLKMRPTPRRVFPGVGGGVYKVRPRMCLGPEHGGLFQLLRESIPCFVRCGFRRQRGWCTFGVGISLPQNFDLHCCDPL